MVLPVSKEDLSVLTLDQLVKLGRLIGASRITRALTKQAAVDRLADEIQRGCVLRRFHLEHVAEKRDGTPEEPPVSERRAREVIAISPTSNEELHEFLVAKARSFDGRRRPAATPADTAHSGAEGRSLSPQLSKPMEGVEEDHDESLDDEHGATSSTRGGRSTVARPPSGEVEAHGADWHTATKKKSRKKKAKAPTSQGAEQVAQSEAPKGPIPPEPALPKALQAFEHALAEIHNALQVVGAAIEKDKRAGRDTATTKLATVVSDAAKRAEALVGGAAVAQIAQTSREVAKQKRELESQQKRQQAAQPRGGVGTRRWADVARGGPPHGGSASGEDGPMGQRRPVPWSNSRTVFFEPVDEAWRGRHVSDIVFGMAVRNVLKTAGLSSGSLEQLRRTSRGDFKAQFRAEAMERLQESTVQLEGLGDWRVRRPRVPIAASFVIRGVDLSLGDTSVKNAVVTGAQREGALPEAMKEKVKEIEVRRMQQKRRVGQPQTGAGDADAGPLWSKCVRVFTTPELRDFFTRRGFIRLDFLVHAVTEYTPPQFYCKHCKKWGSHSSKYHRFAHPAPAGAASQ